MSQNSTIWELQVSVNLIAQIMKRPKIISKLFLTIMLIVHFFPFEFHSKIHLNQSIKNT